MITSPGNPKIQWVRSLQSRSRQRRQAGAFVVEGVRLVEEALAAGWGAQLVLHTEELSDRGQKIVHGFAAQGTSEAQVTPQVMRVASDTETPQGILAVLPMRSLPLPEELDFVLILDGVRDPGNMGTMLRTSAAAGVDAVLLTEGTVDVFAPKVVRAAMGAHFNLPFTTTQWGEISILKADFSWHVFLADAKDGEAYTQVDLSSPLAIIVGGEAEGPSKTAQKVADVHLHIPMPGDVESLNVASAAAVLLFEVVRQRT
jgi:TrmH family RNA methyltransferase